MAFSFASSYLIILFSRTRIWCPVIYAKRNTYQQIILCVFDVKQLNKNTTIANDDISNATLFGPQ